MKKKKIIKRFFAWLYVGAMSVPLLALVYHVVTGFGDVGQASVLEQAQEGVTTPSAQLTSDAVLEDAFLHTSFDFLLVRPGTFPNYETFKVIVSSRTYSSFIGTYVNALNLNSSGFGPLKFIDFFGILNFSSTADYGWALFINIYLNYLLNMSLILFMPEILMLFICWCRDLIYSISEKKENI